MDCAAASERLPWLLTGSLEALEAEEVRTHLEGCPRCREEMDETRRAAAVFGAHLPTALILDLAWERPVEAELARVARAHLDGCAACRDELQLAGESRQLESAWPEASAIRKPPSWRAAFLPATLAAGVMLGFWWGARDRPAGSDSPQTLTRLAALEAELLRLRAAMAARDVAPPTPLVPRLNLPVFELLPNLVQRGPQDQENEVVFPRGATEIALLLPADVATGARAALTLQDGEGQEVWRGDGLIAGPPGGYTVVIPVELLAEDRYVLTVTPAGGSTLVYRVSIKRNTTIPESSQ
jgi:hypothetical protein